jgi:ABC-2 type transport system ATP-binding protein
MTDLEGQERKLVGEASGGMKRRLALAATLVHDPELLVLDEPTAGIDPILRRRFWDHFRELAGQGRTLVVSTQYVGEAADCDLVALIANGRLLHLASPQELRRAAYGGDVLEIETRDPLADEQLRQLAALAEVDDVDRIEARRVRCVVDDAGVALPRILHWLERAGATVTDSKEVPVSYDEVFVRLVEGASSEDVDAERDAPPTSAVSGATSAR